MEIIRSIQIIIALITVLLIRLLRPFVIIRFGKLFAGRLGHQAANTECYLCEKDAKINRPKRVFDVWMTNPPANEYLMKMFARVMLIDRTWFSDAVTEAGSKFKFFREGHSFSDSQWGRDIHNLMEKTPPHLRFTKAEERRGRRELAQLGIPEGAKWVCVLARDSIFLTAMAPGIDWSYHNYRDTDINNYRLATQELIKRGYYVVRMGAFVAGPMKLTMPGFIDYACSTVKSDFLDVYLGAKCEFCLTNGSGFDAIPMIFRKPLCFVNEAPLEYISTWMKGSLVIWKHHYRGGKRMTVKEVFDSGAGLFTQSEQFRAAGITLQENTPEEIRDAAMEMADKLSTGNWWASEQGEFWRHFPRSLSPVNSLPLHGELRLRIGAEFLKQYV